MDTLDDFEMKPLTKGLGFHKKSQTSHKRQRKAELAQDVIPKSIPKSPAESLFEDNTIDRPLAYEDLLKSLADTEPTRSLDSLSGEIRNMDLDSESTDSQKSREASATSVEISEPLPRKPEARAASMELPVADHFPTPMPLDDLIKDRQLPVDEIDDIPIPGIQSFRKTPTAVKNPTEDTGVRRSSSNDPQSHLEKSPICLRSIALDGLIVVAMAMIFLVSLLAVTGVGISAVFGGIKTDLATQVPLAVLYIAVYQIYVIGTRSFYGRTLGEWTFDHQLGRDEEQMRGVYPVKVLWRSLLIVVTGIVTLPLLSFFSRVDVASYLTGLQLYRLRD
ncbi:MAG: hypothetical protein CL677_05285 [Bdellovibrionaceae bacterium]|nr:hypothetical protein [Pseudobdellovibrionaceae bacterium]